MDETIDLERYKAAAAELDSGQRDEGLWLKAFSESAGNDAATKATYIRLRVEQLRKSAVAGAAKKFAKSDSTKSNAQPKSIESPPHGTNHKTEASTAPRLGAAKVAQTLYDIVGVSPEADAATIATAIENQMKAISDVLSPENRQRQKVLLTYAHEVLLNPEQRQVYDARIFESSPTVE
jgi:hypothetical protein